MNKSEQIGELAAALSKLQGEMKGAEKDSKNPFFKSSYASLESVWEACRPLLAKNSLSVVQTMGYLHDAGPTLVTTLLHSSGQWIAGEQPLCAKSATPQDLGSAISYSRRYGLSALLGVIQSDDDGESAQAPHRAPQAQSRPPQSIPRQGPPPPTDADRRYVK